MVMNVHLLKHVLWCHSAFAFERNNGVLLKKVNGTTDVLLQVASKYSFSKAIDPHRNLKRNEKILFGRSTKIIEKSLRVFNMETLKKVDLSNKELSVHKRIKLNTIMYTGTMCTLQEKR